MKRAIVIALLVASDVARAGTCSTTSFLTDPTCTLYGTKAPLRSLPAGANANNYPMASDLNNLAGANYVMRTEVLDLRADLTAVETAQLPAPPVCAEDEAVRWTGAAWAKIKVNTNASAPWSVTVTPSMVVSPTVVSLSEADLTTKNLGACSGPMYWVALNDSTDYVVKSAQVLTHPVFIQGGRNLRIVGLEIDLNTTTPCGGAGVQIPGTFALRVDNVGATYMEGMYLDAGGKVADAIAIHNTTGGGIDFYNPITSGTEAAARGTHDIILQNSVIRGYFAYGGSDEHADTMQPQGQHEIFRNITFENVSVDSGCEGPILLARDGFAAANQITVRNWDYRLDTRFNWNSSLSRFSTAFCGGGTSYYGGGPLMLNAKAFSYSNVYLSNDVVRQYDNSTACGAGCVQPCDGSTGIFCPAAPPNARFASPGTSLTSNAWTGLKYISPWPVP